MRIQALKLAGLLAAASLAAVPTLALAKEPKQTQPAAQ